MAHELTFEQIQDSKKAFDTYRKDANAGMDEAKMDISNLLNALLILEFDVGQEEIKELVTNMSLPPLIDFPTFLRVAAVKYKQIEFIKEVELSFKAFDKSTKGYLTYDELKSILTDYGPKISLDKADNLLKEAGIEPGIKHNYDKFVNEKI